jgi:hypothetical protein
MSEMLHSTVDVIEALGGTRAVAELTGRTYPAIQSALKERGLEAPPELWGMTQSEDA